MKCHFLAALLLFPASAGIRAADGGLIDSMDENHFHPPKEKGKAELVDGKAGKAVQFAFDKDARSAFFTSNHHGTPEWDKAAGLSFWVKGDGSDGFGALQLIYDEDYSVRYDFAFPLKNTDWNLVVVPWRDFVPVLPGPKSNPLDPAGENKPSKISSLFVGKWWYWGADYPACSFAIDDIRLVDKIDLDAKDYTPEGPPLARVLAKLKAGKPITVVTMGDSLTDTHHWSNHETNWPTFFKKDALAKYQSAVTVVNPAIGGTQLRQNLVLIPTWLAKTPEPDLVTIFFGGNDWDAGMRQQQFAETCREAVDRVRRATHGKADVLLLTTAPSAARWGAVEELAEACREAAHDRKAGLADVDKAFTAAGRDEKEREKLFASDHVHLGPAGQELTARTVLEAIEGQGK